MDYGSPTPSGSHLQREQTSGRTCPHQHPLLVPKWAQIWSRLFLSLFLWSCNKCADDDALPPLQQLQQGDALLKTCSSPTSRFADPFQHCSLLSKSLKAVNPLYSFLTAWEAKARSPFFFYGWKNCARGECLNIRKFFMELNWMTITNLSCVPVWLHIFSAQRARKEKCSVCLDNPWRHSSYVGCSLEHFDMDVCVYSTLMAELLQNDEWPGIYNYNRCNAINHHLGAVFHR